METCQRKTIFGRPACRFEGRYEVEPAVSGFKAKGSARAVMLASMEFNRRTITTYVRNICVKCGKTIERQSKEIA